MRNVFLKRYLRILFELLSNLNFGRNRQYACKKTPNCEFEQNLLISRPT